MASTGYLRRAAALACLLLGGCLPAPWWAPPPGPGAGPPPAGPPPFSPNGYNQANAMQAADLAQKLGAVQDENKVLIGRLQELQLLLEEKERAIGAARAEIKSVTEEVVRTRQELSHFRQEVVALRERSRHAEKETQTTLQALVNLLESMLERDSPRPTPAPPAAKEARPISSTELRSEGGEVRWKRLEE